MGWGGQAELSVWQSYQWVDGVGGDRHSYQSGRVISGLMGGGGTGTVISLVMGWGGGGGGGGQAELSVWQSYQWVDGVGGGGTGTVISLVMGWGGQAELSVW